MSKSLASHLRMKNASSLVGHRATKRSRLRRSSGALAVRGIARSAERQRDRVLFMAPSRCPFLSEVVGANDLASCQAARENHPASGKAFAVLLLEGEPLLVYTCPDLTDLLL
jgi:hypothetical protein